MGLHCVIHVAMRWAVGCPSCWRTMGTPNLAPLTLSICEAYAAEPWSVFERPYETEEVEAWEDGDAEGIGQTHVHVCFQTCFHIPQWV